MALLDNSLYARDPWAFFFGYAPQSEVLPPFTGTDPSHFSGVPDPGHSWSRRTSHGLCAPVPVYPAAAIVRADSAPPARAAVPATPAAPGSTITVGSPTWKGVAFVVGARNAPDPPTRPAAMSKKARVALADPLPSERVAFMPVQLHQGRAIVRTSPPLEPAVDTDGRVFLTEDPPTFYLRDMMRNGVARVALYNLSPLAMQIIGSFATDIQLDLRPCGTGVDAAIVTRDAIASVCHDGSLHTLVLRMSTSTGLHSLSCVAPPKLTNVVLHPHAEKSFSLPDARSIVNCTFVNTLCIVDTCVSPSALNVICHADSAINTVTFENCCFHEATRPCTPHVGTLCSSDTRHAALFSSICDNWHVSTRVDRCSTGNAIIVQCVRRARLM